MSIVEDVRGALASREADPSALCAKVREMWPNLCVDVQASIMGDIRAALVEAHRAEVGSGWWAALWSWSRLWSWCARRAEWADIPRVLACSEQCAARAIDDGARAAAAYPGELCGVCGTAVEGGPGWQILSALLKAVGAGDA